MRSCLAMLSLAALCAALPARVTAWGFPAHKHIADRMIALLPAPIRPLYEARRAFIVERSVDPDLWRNVGWEEEPPNHFLDLDSGAYGPFPFADLPREYDKAVEKFGKNAIHAEGLLPWRTAEFYGRLERAFASLARPVPPMFALDDIALYSAVLCHYVADGHVPLHAVSNYDGQQTGQPGAHARFESELFERYASGLTIAPVPQPPVLDPRAAMFQILLDSNRLGDRVLAADRAAAAGREFYDDGFFDAYRASTWPVVDARVADSIASVAAFITGAWERAGKPAVPLSLARTPRRVPKTPAPGR